MLCNSVAALLLACIFAAVAAEQATKEDGGDSTTLALSKTMSELKDKHIRMTSTADDPDRTLTGSAYKGHYAHQERQEQAGRQRSGALRAEDDHDRRQVTLRAEALDVSHPDRDVGGDHSNHTTPSPTIVTFPAHSLGATSIKNTSPKLSPSETNQKIMRNQENNCSDKNKDKCEWKLKNNKKKKQKCPTSMWFKKCNYTCGKCCVSDDSHEFKIKNGNMEKCTFINTTRKRKKYCKGIQKQKCAHECKSCVDWSISVPQSDQASILRHLYESTKGEYWKENDNWKKGTDPCKFEGVKCSVLAEVIGISLSDNNLVGKIPPQLKLLKGLKILDLSNNTLSGAMPTQIGLMSSITVLSLSVNRIDGLIPTELGNLINLRTISLRDNKLSGTIPSEIGKLKNLKELQLDENELTGPMPLQVCNLQLDLVDYETFLNDCAPCKDSGEICKDISNEQPTMKKERCRIEKNYLQCPRTCGRCCVSDKTFTFDVLGDDLSCGYIDNREKVTKYCRKASIRKNCGKQCGCKDFSKPVTPTISSSPAPSIKPTTEPSAERTAIPSTVPKAPPSDVPTITPITAPITAPTTTPIAAPTATPTDSPTLTRTPTALPPMVPTAAPIATPNSDPCDEVAILMILYQAMNGDDWTKHDEWGEGESPCEWFGVECNNQGVFSLNLFDNNLVGSIPSVLGKLTGLTFLQLDKNYLEGTIPTEFGMLTALMYLSLDINYLQGTIPTEFGKLKLLTVLLLDMNRLTGSIPQKLCELEIKTLEVDDEIEGCE